MTTFSLLAIPLGYLIGSFPSSLIVGRLLGKTDMRIEGDGKISAAAVYRRLGIFPYALVLFLDIGKGVISIHIARLLTTSLSPTDSLYIILITGLVTVIGHCWSIFMKFRGGLGATAVCGVLIGVVFIPLLIGLVTGVISLFITRKNSSVSTGVVIIVTSIALLLQDIFQFQDRPLVLIVYPIILIMVMILKRLQIGKHKNLLAKE
jgi:glycerol-3-phosphate acyltransferase PlsY